MKKVLIVCLAGINLVALAGLIAAAALPRAEAQTQFLQTDYVVYVGSINQGQEAVYIVDLASQKMATIGYDDTSKKVVYYRGRDLGRDFRSPQPAGGRPAAGGPAR